MISTFQSLHKIIIPIYKKTHEVLILTPGILIATLSISNQEIDLQSLNIHIYDVYSDITLQINSHHTSKCPHIEENQSMSEKEKEEAFLH
jgi:hypothetical protein